MDKRRIIAWTLLGGFILLIINLLFIHFQWALSLVIYFIIAGYFLLVINRKKRS